MATLSAMAGLLFWALMPVVFGWQAALVVSGSMTPAVRPGDIVVVAPLPTATLARARGMIILVDDPAVPGALLLHRVVGHTSDGALITRGDANRENDRAAVPLADVHGAARLRVPYAGLPVLWLRTGHTGPLVALAFGLLVLAWPQPRQRHATADPPTPQPDRHHT
ncbi:MAG TPA: S26 family signal peptidase [Catenuloplanes sp.]|jgi:signal peptidase